VLLSSLLTKPGHFIWVLVFVLFIDFVWGLFAHFGPSSRTKNSAEGKWALINFAFITLAVGYLINQDIYLEEIKDPIKLSFPIATACMFRSIADYIWCWQFYFPKDEE
jgi:hypothetical protein